MRYKKVSWDVGSLINDSRTTSLFTITGSLINGVSRSNSLFIINVLSRTNSLFIITGSLINAVSRTTSLFIITGSFIYGVILAFVSILLEDILS